MERRQNRTLSSERRFPSSYHPGDADAVIHPRCAEDCALYTLGKARVSSTCGGTARCEAARVDGFQLAKQDTGQTRCIHKSASAMHSQLLIVVYHTSAFKCTCLGLSTSFQEQVGVLPSPGNRVPVHSDLLVVEYQYLHQQENVKSTHNNAHVGCCLPSKI